MGINSKIPGQLDGGAMGTDSQISGCEVDDIALLTTAEAIVPLVQLQTGVVIIVEGTFRKGLLLAQSFRQPAWS